MTAETAVQLAIALPLFGALLIGLLDSRPNLRETVTLASAAGLFALVAFIFGDVRDGAQPSVTLTEILPGLPLALRVEPLGMLFALVASFLWIVTSVYSIGYMRGHGETHQTRFYVCFAVSLSAAIGVAFAGNMLTLFVFYEALTLSTYPLVTHAGTPEAWKAGRTYLGILLGTSIGLLLLAIVATWLLAGTVDFRAGGVLRDTAPPALLGALYVLYVLGVGKAALMPFHRWLPAAMVAPTPVSALLHAVAVVKAGVFTILKLSTYLFGLDVLADLASTEWLLYLSGATILIASLVAMRQDNLKRRLAYSTISQLSYVVLGATLATPRGVIGGSMHIAMHAFGKITLFFCAGAILVATHKTRVSELRGLGRTMPVTMGAFLVASLSIIGLPPMGGMWSKWFLALGAVESGKLAMLAVLMLSSLLNVGYLLTIPLRAFFSAPQRGTAAQGIREAPLTCVAALVTSALGCIALFLFPDPFYDLVTRVVQR